MTTDTTHSTIPAEIQLNWMEPKQGYGSPLWDLTDYGELAAQYQGRRIGQLYRGMAIGDPEALEWFLEACGKRGWFYIGKYKLTGERTEKLTYEFIPGVGRCVTGCVVTWKTTSTFAPIPYRRVRQPVEVEPNPPPIQFVVDPNSVVYDPNDDPNDDPALKMLHEIMKGKP
jgi:hypothetical protein